MNSINSLNSMGFKSWKGISHSQLGVGFHINPDTQIVPLHMVSKKILVSLFIKKIQIIVN